MAEMFNLQNVLNEQSSYVNQKYTSEETAKKNMEKRELDKAKNALNAEKGFLELTLKEKIKEIMVPERVLEEWGKVITDTTMGAFNPFLQWLEENEIYYNENLFVNAIQADAKQIFFTNRALAKQAIENGTGTEFSMTM